MEDGGVRFSGLKFLAEGEVAKVSLRVWKVWGSFTSL